MAFRDWWIETGQFLNPDKRGDVPEPEFWAREGWMEAVSEMAFVQSTAKKQGPQR